VTRDSLPVSRYSGWGPRLPTRYQLPVTRYGGGGPLLPTRYHLLATSHGGFAALLFAVDLGPDGEHDVAEEEGENFRRKLIADGGELMADYLLRKYLAKPPSCRDMLRHFLQRTSATAFLTNFSLTASRYMLRTSPDDPLEISRNREKSVGVVLSEPFPCGVEKLLHSSKSLYSFIVVNRYTQMLDSGWRRTDCGQPKQQHKAPSPLQRRFRC
jgi:hypothetical protein